MIRERKNVGAGRLRYIIGRKYSSPCRAGISEDVEWPEPHFPSAPTNMYVIVWDPALARMLAPVAIGD